MKYLQGLTLLIFAIMFQLSWFFIGTYTYVHSGLAEGADFRWFYSVGKAFREHGSSHVYDLNLASVYQAEVAGAPVNAEKLLLPNHPPFVFPLMAILAGLDYRTAYYCYFVLVLLIMILPLSTIYQSLRKDGWPRLETLIVVIGLTLFEPFFVSLLKGQDTFLLYSGGLFLLSGWMLEKDWLAGFGLGLTLVRPQIALVLAVPFLFKKRKIWWWFLVTAAGLGLYSFVQLGWSGMGEYLHVLSLSTGVEGFGWDEEEMFNLVGLLLRVAPGLGLGVAHSIGWGCYALALIGLCVLWSRSNPVRLWQLALAVSLSLFAAPHLHYHDLALLAVPIIGWGVTGAGGGKITFLPAAAMLTVVSLVLLIAELWRPIYNIIPYLLMASLPFLIWHNEIVARRAGSVAELENRSKMRP